MIKTLLLIFLGGGIGSVFRYATTLITQKFYTNPFPLATLLVNLIGCFLIGLLVGFTDKMIDSNPDLKFLFITGFCGGYTTFSAFGFENLNLFQTQNSILAISYILLSIVIGIFAVWFGLFLAK